MKCGIDYWYNTITGACQVFKCNRGRCDDTECNKAFAKKRVAMATDLVRQYGLTRFFTLTVGRSMDIDGAWQMIAYWWSLLRKRLKRYCEQRGIDLKYFAILECHKDGYPHVHGFWNVYIPTRTLSAMWSEVAPGKMVWLEVVTDEDKAAEYVSKQLEVAKYIGKDQVASASKMVQSRKRTMWRSKGLLTEFERRKKALDSEAGDKYTEWVPLTKHELLNVMCKELEHGKEEQVGQDMEGALPAVSEEGAGSSKPVMEAQECKSVADKEVGSVTRTACQDQCRSAQAKGVVDYGETKKHEDDTAGLQYR